MTSTIPNHMRTDWFATPSALASLNGSAYTDGDEVTVFSDGATGQGKSGEFVLTKNVYTNAEDYGVFVRCADYATTGAVFVRKTFHQKREIDFGRDYNLPSDLTTDVVSYFDKAVSAVSDKLGGTIYLGKHYFASSPAASIVSNVTLTSRARSPINQDDLILRGADNLRHHGLIATASGVQIDVNSCVENLVFLNSAQVGNLPYADQTAATAGVAAFAGTPIRTVGNNALLKDLLLLGYATPFEQNAGCIHVENVRFDCLAGPLYTSGGSSVSRRHAVYGEPWLTAKQSFTSATNARPGPAFTWGDNSDKDVNSDHYAYGYRLGSRLLGAAGNVNMDLFDAVRVDSGNITPAVNITNVADSAGSPGSQILVTTDAAHGLSAGEYVYQAGTTDYNGLLEVTAVASTTTYEVAAAYTSSQAGTAMPVSVGCELADAVQLPELTRLNIQNYGIGLLMDTDGNGSGVDERIDISGGTIADCDYYYALVKSGRPIFRGVTFTQQNTSTAVGIRWENGADGGAVIACVWGRMGNDSGDGALMEFASDTERYAVTRHSNIFDATVREDKRFIDNFSASATRCDFSAVRTSTVSNATGDGTAYTIVFDTERRDVGSNFSTSTGVFSAPVNGWYEFFARAKFQQVDSDHRMQLKIFTTTSSYDFFDEVNDPDDAEFSLGVTCRVYLDAGDSAYVLAIASGGAAGKVVDVVGSASDTYTYFQGRLVEEVA